MKVYNRQRKQWFLKESTFFPRSWSYNRLFHELKHAYEVNVKVEGTECRYSAKTLSGLPVIIIIKGGKLKSIYPIYTGTIE